MRIIQYEGPNGNFGDDLNHVLWKALLPPACFEADDAVLLGIGSIFRDDFLSPEATADKRVFVLGSGAGTGPLPTRWPNPDWSILAVRGPLTGQLIGRPDLAVTDSAALLTVADSLLPRRKNTGEVLFVPHYNSVKFSRWEEVCKLTGLTWVDPHWGPERILSIMGRSRLIVTEAMHGAIVADTLRIPWIPVVCSPGVLPFKWSDWTKSLGLTYQPHVLPPSSGWEALKHFKIRVSDRMHARREIAPDRDDLFIEDFYRRFGGVAAEALQNKRPLKKSAVDAIQKATTAVDPIFVDRAAKRLLEISQKTPLLSEDNVFKDRVERLQTALEQLRRALLN